MATLSKIGREMLLTAQSGEFMDGYIESHKNLTGATLTPREVLERYGFSEDDIQEYFARTNTTE